MLDAVRGHVPAADQRYTRRISGRNTPQGDGGGRPQGAASPPGAPSLVTGENKSIRARCERVRLMNRETRREYGAACGSWGCGICAPVKRSQVIRRLHLGLTGPGARDPRTRPRFLTLTCPPHETDGTSCAQLGRRWQALRQIVERETGGRVEFLGVVERGQRRRKRVHLHLVIRAPWIRQADWSRWAVRAGFGPVVDIREVKTHQIASYAAKTLGGYLTKAAGERWPPHFRRVRASRGWAPDWIVYRPTQAGQWVRLGVLPEWTPTDFIERLSGTPDAALAPP